jgi:hypothetical protein
MRKLTLIICILAITNILSACKSKPVESIGKAKISAICRGQKIFFKQNKKYGLLKELVSKELALDDFFVRSGHSSEIILTESGYFAKVIPNDLTKAPMFYVDEKGIIKKHLGDTNVSPNDLVCELEEGCTCYDD